MVYLFFYLFFLFFSLVLSFLLFFFSFFFSGKEEKEREKVSNNNFSQLHISRASTILIVKTTVKKCL